MPETVTEGEAEAEEESREELAWASQSPTTRISGTPSQIIYAGSLGDTVEQNGTSFGVVFDNPEVVGGTLYINQARDGGLTSDAVGEGVSRPTDYRIVDEGDRNTTIANGALVTDENGPSTYEEVDEFEEDRVLVWYNGMAGGRIGRTLDFNGRPYADWTDDGSYLVKGLVQPSAEWRDAGGDRRSDLVKENKAPRVARAPVLRTQVEVEHNDDGNVEEATFLDEPRDERMLVDMSRFQGGRTYEIHVFDAEEFEEEVGSVDAEIPQTENGYVRDLGSELEMLYTNGADQILEQVRFRVHMYTGDGWADVPENWSPKTTSATEEFGVSGDTERPEEVEGFTANQKQFISEVVDELAGSGMTPEEMFNGGLNGLIAKFEEKFDVVPETDEVREEVHARVAHLDVEDLE